MSLKLYIPGLKRRVYRALPVLAGLLTMLLCCLLGGMLYSGGRFWAGCEAVYEDTLRLHIRAASDSESDQARKLLVRDALVEETAALTRDRRFQTGRRENPPGQPPGPPAAGRGNAGSLRQP